MSINYKKTDPQAIGHRVMKDRAFDLESKAYSMEAELECLLLMLAEDPTNDNLPGMITEATQGATRFRRAAMRAAGASPLTPEEAKTCHETFLEDWLSKIEITHAERSALLNEAKRQLDLSGEDQLTEEESLEIRVGMDSLEPEIRSIEFRHRFCLKKISELHNDVEDVPDVEEPVNVEV